LTLDQRTRRAAPALLTVSDVTVRFDGLVALDGVSFSIPAGMVCGLIGPNGAGKTTLFNCISGLVRPETGALRLAEENLLERPAHRLPELGIARTFQHLGLLSELTVLENVLLGAREQRGVDLLRAVVRRGAADQSAARRARAILERLGLHGIAHRHPSELPLGTLKRVELARALLGEPRLLLLDEPANGLTHQEVDELAQTLLRVRDEQELTVLVVEHHMGLVRTIADHVVVLDFGRVIARGEPTDVCSRPVVVEAYLGTAA